MLTVVTFAIAAAVWVYGIYGSVRKPDPRPLVRWLTVALLAAAPPVALIGLLIARH
jgi:hypothetical protein